MNIFNRNKKVDKTELSNETPTDILRRSILLNMDVAKEVIKREELFIEYLKLELGANYDNNENIRILQEPYELRSEFYKKLNKSIDWSKPQLLYSIETKRIILSTGYTLHNTFEGTILQIDKTQQIQHRTIGVNYPQLLKYEFIPYFGKLTLSNEIINKNRQ